MSLRDIQRPLKKAYREEPAGARITIRASSESGDSPAACSVDIGRAVYEAQAHAGVGGAGTAACSGDLLVGALAACAQVTCQMVAAAMEIPVESISATATGELDLRGTLGISPDVPVGFQELQVRFDIKAPKASSDQLDALREKTERYCVVLQTLNDGRPVVSSWSSS